jgi:hypothetical protein
MDFGFSTMPFFGGTLGGTFGAGNDWLNSNMLDPISGLMKQGNEAIAGPEVMQRYSGAIGPTLPNQTPMQGQQLTNPVSMGYKDFQTATPQIGAQPTQTGAQMPSMGGLLGLAQPQEQQQAAPPIQPIPVGLPPRSQQELNNGMPRSSMVGVRPTLTSGLLRR